MSGNNIVRDKPEYFLTKVYNSREALAFTKETNAKIKVTFSDQMDLFNPMKPSDILEYLEKYFTETVLKTALENMREFKIDFFENQQAETNPRIVNLGNCAMYAIAQGEGDLVTAFLSKGLPNKFPTFTSKIIKNILKRTQDESDSLVKRLEEIVCMDLSFSNADIDSLHGVGKDTIKTRFNNTMRVAITQNHKVPAARLHVQTIDTTLTREVTPNQYLGVMGSAHSLVTQRLSSPARITEGSRFIFAEMSMADAKKLEHKNMISNCNLLLTNAGASPGENIKIALHQLIAGGSFVRSTESGRRAETSQMIEDLMKDGHKKYYEFFPDSTMESHHDKFEQDLSACMKDRGYTFTKVGLKQKVEEQFVEVDNIGEEERQFLRKIGHQTYFKAPHEDWRLKILETPALQITSYEITINPKLIHDEKEDGIVDKVIDPQSPLKGFTDSKADTSLLHFFGRNLLCKGTFVNDHITFLNADLMVSHLRESYINENFPHQRFGRRSLLENSHSNQSITPNFSHAADIKRTIRKIVVHLTVSEPAVYTLSRACPKLKSIILTEMLNMNMYFELHAEVSNAISILPGGPYAGFLTGTTEGRDNIDRRDMEVSANSISKMKQPGNEKFMNACKNAHAVLRLDGKGLGYYDFVPQNQFEPLLKFFPIKDALSFENILYHLNGVTHSARPKIQMPNQVRVRVYEFIRNLQPVTNNEDLNSFIFVMSICATSRTLMRKIQLIDGQRISATESSNKDAEDLEGLTFLSHEDRKKEFDSGYAEKGRNQKRTFKSLEEKIAEVEERIKWDKEYDGSLVNYEDGFTQLVDQWNIKNPDDFAKIMPKNDHLLPSTIKHTRYHRSVILQGHRDMQQDLFSPPIVHNAPEAPKISDPTSEQLGAGFIPEDQTSYPEYNNDLGMKVTVLDPAANARQDLYHDDQEQDETAKFEL